MSGMKKFNFCYKNLYFYSKFNTIIGLPVFVSRDFHPEARLLVGFSVFYQYLSEVWMFLGLISGAMELTVVWNDVNRLFSCISAMIHTTQILSKVILLSWKRSEFLRQLKRLDTIFERNESLKIDNEIPDFEKFTSGTLRRLKIFEFAAFVVITFWTSLYFVPYFYNSIVNYDSVENATSPIVGYFPFNYNMSPRYQLVIIFQSVLFYFNNLKVVAADSFILGVIIIHILQFRYLNLTLERATQMLNENTHEDPKVVDLRLDSFFVNWIKQHQDSVCVVKATIELLSLFFLIEYAYIVIHTSIPAFVITSTRSWNLNQKIVLIFMCSSSIFTFYLFSWGGDTFNESSEEFGNTFYGLHLFGRKKSYQLLHRMLLFVGRNKHKVFGFSNVYPLCSVTFGAVLRMVMSCYLALDQIKGFKNEE